jgi:hypothetical protein
MTSSRPSYPGIRFGFKEWASVCEALGSGRQILILRRGGIHENGGEFVPSHSDFALLPTYWHQQGAALKPADGGFLSQALAQQPPPGAPIPIHLHAVVTDSFRIQSLSALERVRDAHIWSDQTITERYHRWRTDQIFGLIVRVYELDHPSAIEPVGDYVGCRSWIPLRDPIDILSERAVLSDPAFERQRQELHQRLSDSEVWKPRSSAPPWS